MPSQHVGGSCCQKALDPLLATPTDASYHGLACAAQLHDIVLLHVLGHHLLHALENCGECKVFIFNAWTTLAACPGRPWRDRRRSVELNLGRGLASYKGSNLYFPSVIGNHCSVELKMGRRLLASRGKKYRRGDFLQIGLGQTTPQKKTQQHAVE